MDRYKWVPKKAHIILLGWERGTVRGKVADYQYLLKEWERMRVRKLERQHRRPMQVNFLARTVSFKA